MHPVISPVVPTLTGVPEETDPATPAEKLATAESGTKTKTKTKMGIETETETGVVCDIETAGTPDAGESKTADAEKKGMHLRFT